MIEMLRHVAAACAGVCLGLSTTITYVAVRHDGEHLPAGHWWLMLGLVLLGGVGVIALVSSLSLPPAVAVLLIAAGFGALDVALWAFLSDLRRQVGRP